MNTFRAIVVFAAVFILPGCIGIPVPNLPLVSTGCWDSLYWGNQLNNLALSQGLLSPLVGPAIVPEVVATAPAVLPSAPLLPNPILSASFLPSAILPPAPITYEKVSTFNQPITLSSPVIPSC